VTSGMALTYSAKYCPGIVLLQRSAVSPFHRTRRSAL
jgi:hypothetical protein